ncbi:lactase-phlorizin hydrolase-like [Patiria miniata]|uniref:beta-glucosidase n=1 Tax=Patiria miniata TaxID=46514 RepID=A0A914BAY1_PATMI|nr:lactase-phlorizin hydrolase-like [Patiria miniata]
MGTRPTTSLLCLLALALVSAAVAEDKIEFVYPDIYNDPERDTFLYGTFPEGFVWSSATSSYQIEGAWNVSDKGVGIWDTFTHEGGHVANNDNGDVACDSYHKYKEDVALMKAMGLHYYRFSISWPRLMPDGTAASLSTDGVCYYNDLINELVANDIAPMVTLYHWDLPQALQNHGGWVNETIVDRFNDYARACYENFGDRVKLWITFNEPWIVSLLGHGSGAFAPGIAEPAITVYTVTHHLILSHALAYHTYRLDFKATQNGQVGITLNTDFIEPADRSKPADIEAADTTLQFNFGWFAHPIYIDGDYPEIMKTNIARKSAYQGFEKSRLPEFTTYQKALIKGTGDFIGLNHYTTTLATNATPDVGDRNASDASYWSDQNIWSWKDPNWPGSGSSWLQIVPWGIRRLLKWISDEYGSDIPIYVTENGVSTKDVFELEDTIRVDYYKSYINEVLKERRMMFKMCSVCLSAVSLYLAFVAGLATALAEDRIEFVYPDAYNDTTRDTFLYGTFPEGFVWSTATSSYQIEGAWNVSDKGPSVWDTFTHEGGNIENDDNGDIACDSYHKYKEDVALMKAMGLQFYRFSISWPRLMPDGTAASLSTDGLRYYNDLIDELVANDIAPMVTLYHWDLPQALQDHGGWVNETIVELFNDYARVCFENFGDRVPFWITFNEPWIFTLLGYGTTMFAPGNVVDPSVKIYTVGRHIILAHATAYHTFQREFASTQTAKIGITLNSDYFEPADRTRQSDLDAADRVLRFNLGWFANPIFKNGDYPEIMKTEIGAKSAYQGFSQSRLPPFTDMEKEFIKGTADFFGLNQYTTMYVTNTTVDDSLPSQASYLTDRGVYTYRDPAWPGAASDWLKIVPWGIRRILKWLADEYGRELPIYITENGISTHDVLELDDKIRVDYYKAYINEVLKAIELDKVNVKGYTAWSLMDNFEWASGYTERFGMHYVDFNDPERARTAKASAKFYATVVAENGFPDPSVSGAPASVTVSLAGLVASIAFALFN